MRANIELAWDRKNTYLNYWDNVFGSDVCCRVRSDGTLIREVGENNKSVEEITLKQFIEMVKRRARTTN